MSLPDAKGPRSAVSWGIGVAVGLWLSAVILACQGTPAPLEDTYKGIVRKSEILSQMRLDLHQSVEMEKNAVMALTDEESRAFADQSLAASAAVEQNLNQLRSLLGESPLQDEAELAIEFGNCWAEMYTLDQTILDLAVQNTNLKAARLSQEEGAEAMRRFEHHLEEVIRLYSGTPNEARVTRLSYRALIACLKIHHLHSAHIPEASEEKMDQIETQIGAEEAKVSKALAELARIVGGEGRRALLEAEAAFSDFAEVNAKVLKLSRQNTNVKSLELSLGRKRVLAAGCEEILAAYQEVVRNRGFRATK